MWPLQSVTHPLLCDETLLDGVCLKQMHPHCMQHVPLNLTLLFSFEFILKTNTVFAWAWQATPFAPSHSAYLPMQLYSKAHAEC